MKPLIRIHDIIIKLEALSTLWHKSEASCNWCYQFIYHKQLKMWLNGYHESKLCTFTAMSAVMIKVLYWLICFCTPVPPPLLFWGTSKSIMKDDCNGGIIIHNRNTYRLKKSDFLDRWNYHHPVCVKKKFTQNQK